MRRLSFGGAAAALVLLALVRVGAQQSAGDGPRYTASGELTRPADYREWVYLSTGLNMTYGANAPNPTRNHPFNNVFVNRESYRRFLDSGRWPDKTIFILEIRRSEEHVRPNAFGYTQAAMSALEAAVKDSRNGAQPWAYYGFGGGDSL